MAEHRCPVWIGYLLASPLRKLMENPEKIFLGLVGPGMKVLEPGCAMGYFTLALARMVGPDGRVYAVDVEPRMLAGLEKRAGKAGLAQRIEARLCPEDGLGVQDLAGQIDFAAAIHVVHEVPDPAGFFAQVAGALKPGGRLLFREPKGHVKAEDFQRSLDQARDAGLEPDGPGDFARYRQVVLVKP